MAIEYTTPSGEITFDTDTRMYTVWNVSYNDILCETQYLHIATQVLDKYEEGIL